MTILVACAIFQSEPVQHRLEAGLARVCDTALCVRYTLHSLTPGFCCL